MVQIGHYRDAHGQSVFRVFAPEKSSLVVQLPQTDQTLPMQRDTLGYWQVTTGRLPAGTLYWLEVDGQRLPDPASRCQPQGVHGPSMVVDIVRAASPGWSGVRMADAILYELHVGTFTPEGTLSAAQARLPYLEDLGINVVELLPMAAFPGERNWGYDGTFMFALHQAYGDYGDLKAFIEAAHAVGIAVVLDVVYNHFGPEGNYSGAFAPYTKAAATPWGAAINFDGAWNHGVRAYFLDNLRYWLQDIGFDGVRMDAVSLIFDVMPVHILREFTALARSIGRAERREVLTIAEHLRNDRHVTAESGFGYQSQWNDDLNHAVFACMTGETARHYANFGPFEDVVKALRDGFVLDGTRLDRHFHYLLGTDGSGTHGSEHVVHIQNHDQVGNRPRGDRLVANYGAPRALLGLTAVMASPFVPMLFMGEEYGETAPFLFFEDFGDPAIVEGVRQGRKADFDFGGMEPPDPHARSTFEVSKLQWERAESTEGRPFRNYVRRMIALKRSGELGPRERQRVRVDGNAATRSIQIETPHTLTVMNFSVQPLVWQPPAGWQLHCMSVPDAAEGTLAAYGAVVLRRAG